MILLRVLLMGMLSMSALGILFFQGSEFIQAVLQLMVKK
jgi:hypothetical protein